MAKNFHRNVRVKIWNFLRNYGVFSYNIRLKISHEPLLLYFQFFYWKYCVVQCTRYAMAQTKLPQNFWIKAWKLLKITSEFWKTKISDPCTFAPATFRIGKTLHIHATWVAPLVVRKKYYRSAKTPCIFHRPTLQVQKTHTYVPRNNYIDPE